MLPAFDPRPWGTQDLSPIYPNHKFADKIGEAWLSGDDCKVANGPLAGKTLAQLSEEYQRELVGDAARDPRRFPLLLKFLFPHEKLSVQVHPDDAYAAKHEQAAGGRGKTEMWYAVNARAGAEVLVGLKAGVTKENFTRAILDGTAENCLDRIPIRPGDAVFVPAGTAHTIGPGLVLCEIQEFSDLTYRVYDYNRRDRNGQLRPLHVDKALEVMRFGKQVGGKIVPVVIDRGRLRETHYAVCEYFATEHWAFTLPIEASVSSERFELLIFLEGRGDLCWGAQSAAYLPAEVWLLPAALGRLELVPEAPTSLLRTFVPGDLGELRRRLAERGVSQAQWLSLVHR